MLYVRSSKPVLHLLLVSLSFVLLPVPLPKTVLSHLSLLIPHQLESSCRIFHPLSSSFVCDSSMKLCCYVIYTYSTVEVVHIIRIRPYAEVSSVGLDPTCPTYSPWPAFNCVDGWVQTSTPTLPVCMYVYKLLCSFRPWF